jgi:hypothetical protein
MDEVCFDDGKYRGIFSYLFALNKNWQSARTILEF